MKDGSFASRLIAASHWSFIAWFIFGCICLLHLIIFFTITTDNNGDPNEYLAIARTLFMADSPINPNRFIGYPLFLKVTSLNLRLINLTFFAQHILFLFALWFFAKKITDIPLFRALIYLPGLIPSIAYIPNLLFPDCLILSLLLLLGAYLYSGQFIRAFFVGLCLILIKLVFIFVPVIVIGAYLLTTQGRIKYKYTLSMLGVALLGLIPAVFVFSPFPLYQSVVQKPSFIDEPAIPTAVPSPLTFRCGGQERILFESSATAKFTDHSSDLYHMPLGQPLVQEFGCTPAEVKTLQRELVVSFFTQAPAHQFYKFMRRFVRNTFMLMDVPHVGYMLELKYQLMTTNFSPSQFYEKTQLEYFEGQGMKPLRPPGELFLRILNSYNFMYERILSFALLGIVCVGIVGILLKKIPYISLITPLLLIIIFYNFSITFFAFGYDRYIFVNYFLWIAIIVSYLSSYLMKRAK